MKIATSQRFVLGTSWVKIALSMKLFAIFMLAACIQVSAKGYGQKKITLQLKSVNLKQALHQLEKSDGVRFLYNDALIGDNQKVNLDAKNEALTKVLDELFAGTSITYKIMEDDLVVLSGTGNEDGKDDKDSQSKLVKGKVTDSDGKPVSGASITIKGSQNGVAADANGNYVISADQGVVLVFSSTGTSDVERTVGAGNVINVILASSIKSLDEVVVIGYGTASKRDLTGSIVKIAGKDVADKPNTNPVASLQSKVAGLSVVNNGTPGAAPDIRIRGTVSIGQVHPLYVVDGVFNDNIDYINPNDIESIEILKDPSSLAIFGVKGATGVIAITTKKAKAGQTIINFNTTYGFKKLVDKIQLVNGDQFKTLFAEENANAVPPVTTPFDYTGLTANTDWINSVTRTANFNTNNLSVASSSEKNRFNFGLGYTKDQGIIKHEQLEKMQLSLSDEFKLSKAIRLGTNLNVSRQNLPYDATSVLDNARKAVPLVSDGTKSFRVKNPYASDTSTIVADIYSGLNTTLQNSGVVNPLLQLENEWDKTINIEYRMVGSVFAEITFLKNFTFRSTFYADISWLDKRQYSPLYYAYNPVNNTPYLYNQTTKLQENQDNYRKFQQDHILSWKKSFGDHNLTATAGFTTYYFGHFGTQGLTTQGQAASSLPIPNDPRFWYLSNGFGVAANTQTPSSQNEYTTVSVLARVLYNYKGKYFLNGSLRDDASSQIPAKNRHQQFWAVGAAWDLTKEDFMKNQQIFDFLKIKGSVGVLGNQSSSYLDGTPINYPAYPLLNSSSSNSAVFGTNVYNAAVQAYKENPDLKWETVNAQEIGIELNAFKNKLHFEANYYNKTTNNLMTFVDRSSQGLQNELINGGSVRNWGEEFSATWNHSISKDFNITLSGNLTFQQNKVISLASDLPSGTLDVKTTNNGAADSRTAPGQAIASFYGYKVIGIFQTADEIAKSPSESSFGAIRPGDFKYADVNGDGVVDANDRIFLGNPTPKLMYGGSIGLNYKGIGLGIDIGGVSGNQIFRTWGSLESPFQRVNYAAFKLNRWHGVGTSNLEPILGQGDRVNYNGSSYNIESGTYFRIRNVQLSYAFPQNMLSKANIKGLRIFANAQNLKTFKHNYGYTPEYGGNATSFGYDNAGGAIPVVTTLGLNVTF